MFTKVNVKFTNKDGVEEIGRGTLLAWYEDGDGYVVSYIVLDNNRFVTVTGHTEDLKYEELVKSNIQEAYTNPYFKNVYDPFKTYSMLKIINESNDENASN